jgi:hypothetical protein
MKRGEEMDGPDLLSSFEAIGMLEETVGSIPATQVFDIMVRICPMQVLSGKVSGIACGPCEEHQGCRGGQQFDPAAFRWKMACGLQTVFTAASS